MNTFGKTEPKIVPISNDADQFGTYQSISRHAANSFLFESLTGPEELAEMSVMGFDPGTMVRGYSDRLEVSSDGKTRTIHTDEPLGEIKKLLRSTNSEHRYLGGAVGVVSYDSIRLWEELPGDISPDELLMEFGIYDDGIVYDRQRKKAFYFHYGNSRLDTFKTCSKSGGGSPGFSASAPIPNKSEDEFAEMVNAAKKKIHDGDIFQAVLSRRFSFDVEGDPLNAYKILRKMNPSPYLYHIKHGSRTVIGSSPEMLIRVSQNTAETFPIAGTRKVTASEAENQRLAQELLCDEKELAEHTMLVDLGRNDIGRVCRYGTVRVQDLMKVKRFSHVQHMVTQVLGEIRKDMDMFDAFRAVFPAGTVTGAPKIRAMEIIEELEGCRRESYAGAVGYFSHTGCCDFAIAIRSIFISGARGYIQAGAGIVSDSVPASEFQETEDKARAMIQAIKEASR